MWPFYHSKETWPLSRSCLFLTPLFVLHCINVAIVLSALVNVVVRVRSFADDSFTDIIGWWSYRWSNALILFITEFKALIILLNLLSPSSSSISFSLVISVCRCFFVFVLVFSSQLCVIACFFNLVFVHCFILFHGKSCLFALTLLHSVKIFFSPVSIIMFCMVCTFF